MQDEDEVSGKSTVALSFDQWPVLRHLSLLSLLDSLVLEVNCTTMCVKILYCRLVLQKFSTSK